MSRSKVLDNNVVMSAAFTEGGTCSELLNMVLHRFQPVASPAIIHELTATLLKPKFARYGSLQVRSAFLERYVSRCFFIEGTVEVHDCRDPEDNQFLAAALEAGADLIVTGDQDLLALNPWRGILILTPADALMHLA